VRRYLGMSAWHLLQCFLKDGLDGGKDAVFKDPHLFVVEVLKVLWILEQLFHPGVEEIQQVFSVHGVQVVSTDHGVLI